MTNMSEDVNTTLSEMQNAAARKLVCASAVGADHAEQLADAEDLMMMLGIHPGHPAEMDYLTGPQGIAVAAKNAS